MAVDPSVPAIRPSLPPREQHVKMSITSGFSAAPLDANLASLAIEERWLRVGLGELV